MSAAEAKLELARQEMVQQQLRMRGIFHAKVLRAFADVPRERFVPAAYAADAYADEPVPIGEGQTISQPFVVAWMLQELDPHPEHRVLDVGAGSGYQTALLATLSSHVYAIERLETLTERAMGVLASLNVTNVTLCTGDGSLGWASEAPFDRIICGAGAPEVPQAWLDQLADHGRIVVPVGGPDNQMLVVLEKSGDDIRRREIGDVRFVRLIGRNGWPEEPPHGATDPQRRGDTETRRTE